MPEVRQTAIFARWFTGLGDRRARARIQVRIDRLAIGNPGDVRPVGDGVSEMRIDYGPGASTFWRMAERWLSSWQAETNEVRHAISQ